MRHNKRESRTAALAAIVIMAAVAALAEEKQKGAGALNPRGASAGMRRVVISVQDCKLALLEGDRVVKTWSTAVGAQSTPSPSGAYTIVNRLSSPTYYAPGKVVPPGPSNPLGTRWLGLSRKGFGIHGTNVPGSIGRKVSHGCIRMRNRDIEELFAMVQVGDVVELHGERNADLAKIFKTDLQQGSAPVLRASAGASLSPISRTF